MKYKLKIKSINNSAKTLFEFFKLDENKNTFLFNYFSVNLEEYKALSDKNKFGLVLAKVKSLYVEYKDFFAKKYDEIDLILKQNFQIMERALSSIFDVKIDKTFKMEIGVCPICPRYLQSYSFDVCAFEENGYILQTIAHELIHFYWFLKLKQMGYRLSKAEKETPSLTWLISEIVVDAIFKNTDLKVFLFNNKPAYNIFYKQKINNVGLIELFDSQYKTAKSIEDFIKFTMNFIGENKEQLNKIVKKM